MMPSASDICVIGLGYIGLPTAAVLARAGFQVHGMDNDAAKVETINSGRAPIVEVDLDGLVQGVITSGRLTASTDARKAKTYILAVPTPLTADKTADLRALRSATEAITPFVDIGDLIIVESTVPPGTTRQVATWVEAARPDLARAGGAGTAFHAAHCPERVLPGRILIELTNNDRVIGGLTPTCADKARAIYDGFISGECLITDAQTAELSKLAENAYRDVNIAFANELAGICGDLDIDAWSLIALANRHPRVNILQPGPGVGGHCIAVDPWFIAERVGEKAEMIKTARRINDARPADITRQVCAHLDGLDTPTVACLGLAFKADIDDLRESPAVTVALALTPHATVLAVEPNVTELPAALSESGIRLCLLEDALATADVIVALTDHKQFKAIAIGDLRGKPVIDTRGIWRGQL